MLPCAVLSPLRGMASGYMIPDIQVCQATSRWIYATDETDADPPVEAEASQARLTSSVSLLAISRTLSLSFQSAFHLSLTVLVRYRSLANI